MANEEATGLKIQELQSIEQTLQSIIMQKQAFLLELEETEKALSQLHTSGEEVYKLIGQLLIKSNKSEVVKDLEKKKEILDLRVKNLEKQEDSFTKRMEALREEITSSMK
jgi:prefoldin beta subunit